MQESTWRARTSAHEARADRWVVPRLARRARGESHPVEDFLFEYYPYSPAKLRAWHPGYGTALEGRVDHFLDHPAYRRTPQGATACISWLQGRRARLDVAIHVLQGSAERPPATGCFGLHEWAMTYQLERTEVRHSSLPLRLAPTQIAETVESIGLRCTHIDAYRFFTPQAVPLNALTPTRANQVDLEQPGCLHASMDLYKYAFWFSPLVGSDLIMDCFENAMQARVIDMRASPYDCSQFGLEPLAIETAQGRREYASEQSALIAATAPLRTRVLDELVGLQQAAGIGAAFE